METGLLVSDLASFDTKTYIWETLLNIKEFLIQKQKPVDVSRKELISIARYLGSLIHYIEHVEDKSRFLNFEFEYLELTEAEAAFPILRRKPVFTKGNVYGANEMCHFINSFMQERESSGESRSVRIRSTLDVFNEVMEQFERSRFSYAHAFQKLDLHWEEEKEKQQSVPVIGLEDDAQILSRHLSSYFTDQIIVILGVQGIGKTTLAQKVCEKLIGSHHFELHIWVTISQEFKPRDILRTLMKKIPLRHLTNTIQYSRATTLELAEELLRVFSSMRCLIVLDGLRTYEGLKALGLDLEKDLEIDEVYKSKIMITTRSRELADHMSRRFHRIHEMMITTRSRELFNAKPFQKLEHVIGLEEEQQSAPVIGLEEDVQILSRQLRFNMQQIIVIVGVQGIGKTTLAKKVCEKVIVTDRFKLHIWVTISQEFEPRDILLNLMKKIPVRLLTRTIQYSTATTLELAEELLRVFNSMSCLVVLDGLRTYEALEALGKMGFSALRESRIMITTRRRELPDLMVMKNRKDHIIHEMRKLSDQEAWELFNAKVCVPKQLQELGLELVRKCMGIPGDIVAVGDILLRRAVTEEQWIKVLNQDFNQNQESLTSHLIIKNELEAAVVSSPSHVIIKNELEAAVDSLSSHLIIINELEAVVDSLPSHLIIKNELEAAVDSLPSHLKDCLSSFELFNDDFDIPMRRLIVYWVAEGHVQQEAGSKKPPEVLAEKQLMEFIQQNMIQVVKWKINGRVKTCRMNYFLRDNWLPKVNKEKSVYNKTKDATFKLSYFLNVNHKEASSKSPSGTCMIFRLADHLDNKEKCFSHIHGNQKISHSSFKKYYGDLCSLVSFDSREGPVPGEAIGNFLRRGIAGRCFKILRVLDLEGVFRPNLPELIRKLLQLRYLGLRYTYIEGLPSTIGKLLNLQTLDLKHTCIRSLPCSVWEMQQLRHIYLSESYRSRIVAPPRTSSLVDFQTLWGAFVDEETLIADGLDRLINLRKLGLVCRLITSQQKELAEWISKLEHLESLRLRSINEMVRPSNLYLKSLSSLYNLSSIYLLGRLENPEFLNALPTSLTEITLSSSELVEDPMKKLEKLPNLRILNLYADSYTGKTMICSSWGFPLLRVLNLWKLEELEEWTVEEGALAIIRDLEIRSCNKFKKIPEGLKEVRACRELKLTNMPDEFKARVVANQGQDWYKIAHIPSVIIKN